jgi:hypothetical protein
VVFEPEFDPILQVGVARKNTSVSPLYLRERARVRGKNPPDTAYKRTGVTAP